ncbi:asparagine synthase (glutamine-hydrolyzing) [Hyunsoonleella pacifica]|uniref:asparagine synthase (glutamine-hydrolyzing) n=1 Tax=Hyunsoonleella pacifica TaxID=1080224 RepID=A0A4Q9FRT6_9FLAO|nr:asparagine synthase (glutamine-hydrolyzing) [Hyunsoonleella pacifica]TBN18506.1 asparagine synthase (glutamine-hydrolyzing) [Hyunsoonleella pacifica]GGD02367.1 asparagine synthetase B [Hyunsoonleella pacifica]
MCGILGQIKVNQQISLEIFNTMRDTLFHRGPDGYGTELFYENKAVFGHRRLSIIDLSDKGKQPMYSNEKDILITFNGEIYNYKFLREALIKKGYRFNSSTDTEVLIYGFKEWGIEELLVKIKGMFAFAIWDKKTKNIYIAKDRFGIKPLYYYYDDKQFAFASELKALNKDHTIKKEIDEDALADFFIYSYVPNPNCIWKHFKKLSPATYMVYSIDNHTFYTEKYWSLSIAHNIESIEEVLVKTNALIKQSVEEHLVSDVPVGLFLSGGYDSSTVLMQADVLGCSPNTFSLGFENSNRSEHRIASIAAKAFNTNHREFLLGAKENYLKELKNISYYYDEPYAISSMLTYYYTSKLASQTNKVALVGDGGDELFGGYNWDIDLYNHINSCTPKAVLKRMIRGRKKEFVSRYNSWMTGVFNSDLNCLMPDLKDNILKRGLWYFDYHYTNTGDAIKDSQYLNLKTFIPQPSLTRADRSSMANSLEVRVPFLDHKLFEYIYSLNTKCYHKQNEKKFILKHYLEKKVPNEVFKMPKYGFSFQFLNKIFDTAYDDMMKNGHLNKMGLIDFSRIKEADTLVKFHLLMLEFWFENYG